MTHRVGKRVSIVVALVLGVAILWALRLVSAWADRTVTFIAVAVVAAAFVLFADWLVASFGPGLWRFTRSVGISIWRAVHQNADVRALVGRHTRLFRWLGRRVTRTRASGLSLTVSAALALYFATGFVSIARSLALSRAITTYDPRVLALLRVFRTPELTKLLWIATVLADPRVIFMLAAVAVLLLMMWGRRAEAALLGVTVSGGVIIQTLSKFAFHRLRPPVTFALIKQPTSFSFPSGHAFASMLLAGVVVFILWRTLRSPRARLAVLFVAGLIVIAVGVSRVYLGVHWMSDVLASWLLALAWLSLTCGGYLMLVRYRNLREGWPAWFGRRVRGLVSLVVSLAVVVIVVVGAQADPLLAQVTGATPSRPWSITLGPTGRPAPTEADLRQLPIFSEKLDGTRQEPIGVVFIGERSQLVAAFSAAGWQVADNPSFATLARASLAAIQNQPYLTAPVTPTFLGGVVQDIAFEKPEGAATVRRRHHVRFWQTHLTLAGVPVWVATASFDSRLEIGTTIPLPTHHIDPNIDAEQAYVVRNLVATGRAALLARARVTQPSTGTNAQGDPWFTTGYASVLEAAR